MKLSRLLAPLAALLLIAGCGGSSHHPAHHRTAHPHRSWSGAPFAQPTSTGPRALAPTATATVEQFDSVTTSTVPGYAQAVAGYTSGFWPTYGPLVAAFPHAYHTSIAVNISHQAQCLDDEPGDASPSQAGWWVNWELRNGWAKPCVYASLSDMPAVRANISAWGIARSRYFLWDADWTYFAHLDPGFDCTQWTDRSLSRNLDESTCTRDFLRARPLPPPGPSHAKVRGWIAGRGSSLHAYYAHHCRQPVLTSGTCGQLAWRVDHFQKLVDTAHGYYPRCFGRHRDLRAAECQVVRPAVAVWTRAREASRKASALCPYASGDKRCPLWHQRFAYFNRRANHSVATSRL